MTYWGQFKYGDGTRVVLLGVKCKSHPRTGTRGTHTCRQHFTHEGLHRCICGMLWDQVGVVSK